jgi:hypothetical protein
VRFLTDQNVQQSVVRSLRALHHDVKLSRNVVGAQAKDEVVATAAVELERVLISHDGDMRRVERYISEAAKRRYPTLCRLMFACEEAESRARMRLFLPVVELWFEEARKGGFPMLIEVGRSRLRIIR